MREMFDNKNKPFNRQTTNKIFDLGIFLEDKLLVTYDKYLIFFLLL